MAFRRELERSSAAWVAEGVISGEQREQILAIEQGERGESGGALSLAPVLSILGAAVIVLGLTLVVASNWENIPKAAKLAVGTALMVATFSAGYWLRYGPLARRRTGEALILVGSGAFLGNLALISQQYHVLTNPSPIFLALWLSVAALPYLLRSTPYALVSPAAFALWLVIEMARDVSPIETVDIWFFLFLAGIAAAWLAAGAAHRLTAFRELAAPTEFAGGALLLFALYYLGFYRHIMPDESPGGLNVALLLVVPALIVVAVAATAWVAWSRDDTARPPAASRAAVLGGAAVVLLMLLWSAMAAASPRTGEEESFILWTAGFWVLALGLAASLGWLGVVFGRTWWLNSALAFVGVFTITRYFDLFSTYGQTGLLFVGAGLLLLLIAFVLERSRRALTVLAEASR